ncbi:unnamed protein product [Prorocentrum cordatum]|uniref:Replication protein A OB domain-containing protein n=1 Tax=Prorocentrum cordatum TaxID=2364126 RepID=A0ABN9SGW7_9DINO|nr:unnamed protein product [Polarella glacialis]
MAFSFKHLSEVQEATDNAYVDLAAIVFCIQDSNTFNSSKTGKELTKREVALWDPSGADGTTVTLTLWGQSALNVPFEEGAVVFIKGAQVREWQGVKGLSSPGTTAWRRSSAGTRPPAPPGARCCRVAASSRTVSPTTSTIPDEPARGAAVAPGTGTAASEGRAKKTKVADKRDTQLMVLKRSLVSFLPGKDQKTNVNWSFEKARGQLSGIQSRLENLVTPILQRGSPLKDAVPEAPVSSNAGISPPQIHRPIGATLPAFNAQDGPCSTRVAPKESTAKDELADSQADRSSFLGKAPTICRYIPQMSAELTMPRTKQGTRTCVAARGADPRQRWRRERPARASAGGAAGWLGARARPDCGADDAAAPGRRDRLGGPSTRVPGSEQAPRAPRRGGGRLLSDGAGEQAGRLKRAEVQAALAGSKYGWADANEFGKLVADHMRANAGAGRGLRREQAKWKRTVPELLAASDAEIVNILRGDKLLVDWTGATCPICGRGALGELVARPHKGNRLLRRCDAKCCRRHLSPVYLNPIFSEHSRAESLQKQAVLLLAKPAGTSYANARVLFGVNRKAVERIWGSVEQARGMHVEDAGPTIEYSGSKVWADVGADEATLDKPDMTDGPEPLGDPTHPVMWGQWLGIVQRGRPRALTLTRLRPEMAEKRAPGPGAARKVDWKPLAQRWLRDRDVVFHADSARSYKLRVPSVIHDFVVHQKKYKKVGGKRVLIPPRHVELQTHVLPSGKHLKVKSGTQIIDRAWRFIKDRLHRSATAEAGTKLLATKIRSAQCDYWRKDDDTWAKTGEMVQLIMRDVLVDVELAPPPMPGQPLDPNGPKTVHRHVVIARATGIQLDRTPCYPSCPELVDRGGAFP